MPFILTSLAAGCLIIPGVAALEPAAGVKPNIVMHLADDFGWANAGWHRPEGYAEVKTPNMNTLVKEGIELDHAYSYKFCSPTRSSLQSGRLPVHVNSLNLAPNVWNAADPVSGFAAIPRNMTGIATKMKSAGYSTHQVGKWDAGMATVDHTPHGRGYDTSFGYFHHDNDYWTEHVGPWVDLYNETETTTWAGPGPAYAPTNGAGYGYNSTVAECAAAYSGKSCGMTGPEDIYEEFKFKTRVLEIINDHDASNAEKPLFLCYTSHIVHEPLQVPIKAFDEFNMIATSVVKDFQEHRQTYHAMVYYMDGVVGAMHEALMTKKMWDNTLWFHQSDNGGPSFSGSSHTANNYPQKGSKMTNWQGGIRVNAFVSGGLLKTAAPAMIGKKLDGFTHVCDWYATWCSLAGVDKDDTRAAAANANGANPKLPAVDGLDLWPYLSGKVAESPRKEVFADNAVLVLEIAGKKWKLFGTEGPDTHTAAVEASPQCVALMADKCTTAKMKGQAACASCFQENKASLFGAGCTADHGEAFCVGEEGGFADPMIYESRADGAVHVGVACWMGPQYPNGTDDPGCNSTMVCPNGCLFDLGADPGEYTDVASQNPTELAVIKARLAALQPTIFDPKRTGGNTSRADKAALGRGGFWGPFIFP